MSWSIICRGDELSVNELSVDELSVDGLSPHLDLTKLTTEKVYYNFSLINFA
jgi:hypothetical protein